MRHFNIATAIFLVAYVSFAALCTAISYSPALSNKAALWTIQTISKIRWNDGSGSFLPRFHDAVYSGALATSEEPVQIDLSHTSDGYVGISVISDHRCKAQVLMGDQAFTCDLNKDAEPNIVPLTMGDGTYTIRVMQARSETIDDPMFARIAEVDCDAHITDQLSPWLIPTRSVSFSMESECVAAAYDLLLENKVTDDETAAVCIMLYVQSQLTYEKDADDSDGWQHKTPDEILGAGRGLCINYATLTAAMCRSVGIPAKVVVGIVPEGRHAWNEIFIGGKWIPIDTSVPSKGLLHLSIGDADSYEPEYRY